MEISNQQLAKVLRSVAAAYTLKKIGNIFQIRAYQNAADAIDQSNAEVFDLWQEGRLSEVPNVGTKIQEYLNELFSTGKVKHFEEVQKGIPPVVFELLSIPGVGPQTATKLSKLGVKDLEGLKRGIKTGTLVEKGFSAKLARRIMDGVLELSSRQGRMLLPYAAVQADRILEYLKKSPDILQAHPLGSLRRMVATVGDLDFSASSNNPKKVVKYFCKFPGVTRVVDEGVNKATVVLRGGFQADLLVGRPESYGALLQHFTGSKAHNIKLRTLAQKKGLSLSEYGVKKVSRVKSLRTCSQVRKTLRQQAVLESREESIKTETEEELYEILGMQAPPPEIREDTGEIEAALQHKLPKLVEFQDIKGDLHTHSNFPIAHPSHGPGADSIEEIIKKAISLGYNFVGISDHPPGFSMVSKEDMIKWVEKRTKFIHSLNSRTNGIQVLNSLEVDILGDGSLALPDEALAMLDYCIAGIHSGHRGSKEEITKRLIRALENPHVDIISHPTNRLLNERESSEVDWAEVFKMAAKNSKILEINGYPNRLDLRDDLVREALKMGVRFIINTDAHEVSQMENMRFGVSVARRGWVTKKDIVNAWDWTKFAEWFKIRS